MPTLTRLGDDEKNPFHVTLTRYDEDPFAPSIGAGNEIAALDMLGRVGSGLAQNLLQRFMTPGVVAQPMAAAVPGIWSDQDEAARQATEAAAAQWGPQMAMGRRF